jgi:hypothetical protein
MRFIYEVKDLYEIFVQNSLKYSDDTKYFALAIENFTLAYDLGLINQNHSFTLVVIVTNLENGHQNVHKLLLELFKRWLTVETEGSNDVDMILNMTWYNRNKYYLLSHLIAIKPEFLLNNRKFNVSRFIQGLRIGLSHYHLYSSSLSLVKIIYNKDPFRKELINISAEILSSDSDYEVNNFLILWFTVFDDKFRDELFKIILEKHDFTKVSSTSKFFHRAVILRLAFDKVLSQQIEDSIKNFCCSIDDVELKIDIFNVLLNDVLKCKDFLQTIENILRLLKFLQCNMCVEDSAFIDNVMKKLPNFFNLLATSRFRKKLKI